MNESTSRQMLGTLAVCLSWMSMAAPPAFAEDPELFPILVARTAYDPQQVLRGDFDNDGLPDLIVRASSQKDRFSYLEGIPGGGFRDAQSRYVGFDVASMRIADLDHDQHLDIVIAFDSVKRFGVMYGFGTGFFTAPITYPTQFLCDDLELVDVNQDGELDAVLVEAPVNPPNGRIRIYEGNGLGRFHQPSTHALGASGQRIAIGDFNGDNDPDLAISNSFEKGVYVLLGAAGASFAPPSKLVTGTLIRELLVEDINGDGFSDIATGDGLAGTVSTLHGDGSGGFTPGPTLISSGDAQELAFADLDVDGVKDLVCATGSNQSQRGLSWLRGLPGGGFAPSIEINWGPPCQTFMVHDQNKDGRPDLLVGGYLGLHIHTFLGNDQGTFPTNTPTSAGKNGHDLRTADVNGDGRPDAIVLRGGPGRISTRFGDGTGGFLVGPESPVIGAPMSLELGDFNQDGQVDAVALDPLNRLARVFLGDGTGNFAPQSSVALGQNPIDLKVHDFDRDGTLDILTANESGPALTLAHGDGHGNFLPPKTLSTPYPPSALATGDIDNDQWVDILVTLKTGLDPAFVFHGGPMGFGPAKPVNLAELYSASRIELVDLDHDGDLDVLETRGHYIYVFEGFGDGTFSLEGTHYRLNGFDDPDSADVDCDGFQDILVIERSSFDPAIGISFGIGDLSTFNFHWFYAGDAPIKFDLHDMNGDERLDVTFLEYAQANISVYAPEIDLCGPQPYCTPKKQSNGCLPLTRSTGTPSSSGATPFYIDGLNVDAKRHGILLYGLAGDALPFQDGTLCIQPPLQWTQPQVSAAGFPPISCLGSFSYDFGARIQSGIDPSLTAGTAVYAQYWFRDPNSPSTTGLADGLRFEIGP